MATPAEALPGGRVPDRETSGIKLVQVDPRSLMRGNVAYKIIDPTRTMVGGIFLPEYYEKARSEVLRVQNPLTGQVEPRTKDGHHRIASGAVYMDTHPDYVFLAHDVTDITLRENYQGRQEDYLTEQQYYAEIGEATKAHGEIEFRRMAGHILSDWRGWVGDDVAERFPALAALHTLGRDMYQVRTLNEVVIHQAIDASEMAIMGNEDGVSKTKLKEGLKAMASRILVTGLGYDELAFAGFQLVTSAYEDIGEEERAHEIQGLLSLRDVDNRLASRVQTPDMHEQQKSRLSTLLTNAFQSITEPGENETDHRGEEIRAIVSSLANTDISYRDLTFILDTSQAGSINDRFKQIKVSEQLKAKGERGSSADVTKIRARSGEKDANQVVLVTADELGKALMRFSNDPTKLSDAARSAVSRVIRQAQRLGVIEGDIRARPQGENGRPVTAVSQDAIRDSSQSASAPEGYVWIPSRGQYMRKELAQIIPILQSIAGSAKKIRVDGGYVPEYITEYPYEVFTRDWQQYANCKDDPDAMDVEGAEQNNAVVTCKGCPVRRSCLADELNHGIEVLENPFAGDAETTDIERPDVVEAADTDSAIEMSQVYVRGGMVARDRRALLRQAPDEARKIIKDVKDATSFQTPIMVRHLR